ncbi:hypothetical protein ACFLT7_00845 [candidate division KSB1 bacterium]
MIRFSLIRCLRWDGYYFELIRDEEIESVTRPYDKVYHLPATRSLNLALKLKRRGMIFDQEFLKVARRYIRRSTLVCWYTEPGRLTYHLASGRSSGKRLLRSYRGEFIDLDTGKSLSEDEILVKIATIEEFIERFNLKLKGLDLDFKSSRIDHDERIKRKKELSVQKKETIANILNIIQPRIWIYHLPEYLIWIEDSLGTDNLDDILQRLAESEVAEENKEDPDPLAEPYRDGYLLIRKYKTLKQELDKKLITTL